MNLHLGPLEIDIPVGPDWNIGPKVILPTLTIFGIAIIGFANADKIPFIQGGSESQTPTETPTAVVQTPTIDVHYFAGGQGEGQGTPFSPTSVPQNPNLLPVKSILVHPNEGSKANWLAAQCLKGGYEDKNARAFASFIDLNMPNWRDGAFDCSKAAQQYINGINR